MKNIKLVKMKNGVPERKPVFWTRKGAMHYLLNDKSMLYIYLQRQPFIIKYSLHIILWETTIHKSLI